MNTKLKIPGYILSFLCGMFVAVVGARIMLNTKPFFPIALHMLGGNQGLYTTCVPDQVYITTIEKNGLTVRFDQRESFLTLIRNDESVIVKLPHDFGLWHSPVASPSLSKCYMVAHRELENGQVARSLFELSIHASGQSPITYSLREVLSQDELDEEYGPWTYMELLSGDTVGEDRVILRVFQGETARLVFFWPSKAKFKLIQP